MRANLVPTPAVTTSTTSRPRRPSIVRFAALGAGLGLAWGVIARGWMRLISEQPEFSWSGTGYILGATMVLGLILGAAEAARRRGSRGAWRAAAAAFALLGAGAGMLTLPLLVIGGITFARPWRPLVRASLATATLAAVVLVGFAVWQSRQGLPGVVGIVLWVGLAIPLAWAASIPFRPRVARP